MNGHGWPSLCLRATDLEASKRFYQAIGMRLVEEVPGLRVVLGFGGFRMALMPFLEENLINVRGGDVRAAHAELTDAFPDLEGEAADYTAEEADADADGCCWATRDPDGNEIFFDTNALETGPAWIRERTDEILEGAIEAIQAIDPEGEVVDALRSLREGASPADDADEAEERG